MLKMCVRQLPDPPRECGGLSKSAGMLLAEEQR